MTIENIYTVKSSFFTKDNKGKVIIREEKDIIKAKNETIAENWCKTFYEEVNKSDLLDWISVEAEPVYITDISFLSE